MRTITFCNRNAKELLRDPLTIFFGAAFPLLLLIILHLIARNVPQSPFTLSSLTPGIAVFGLSFFSLFAGMLIAKDRSDAFLRRLYASPMRAADFLAGYALPLLPLSVLQTTLCYCAACILGLPWSVRILPTIGCAIPMALFHILLGMTAGCVLNDKQVGGLCGAVLTNCCAFLSDSWLPLNILGKGFRRFAECLPFVHAVEWGRIVLQGSHAPVGVHAAVVCGYTVCTAAAAVVLFGRNMRRG